MLINHKPIITPGSMLMSGLGGGPWMAPGWSWSPETTDGTGLGAQPCSLSSGKPRGCCRLSSMNTL